MTFSLANPVEIFSLYINEGPEGYRFVLVENPHGQNGPMAKDAWWVRKVYWRRERAHYKMRVSVVFVVCIAGAFIGEKIT